MPALSIFRDGRPPAVLLAHLVSADVPKTFRSGAEVTFQVLEADARVLKELVGKLEYYVLDHTPFWARLRALTPCERPYLEVSDLRDRAILSGLLSVVEEVATKQ